MNKIERLRNVGRRASHENIDLFSRVLASAEL